MSRSSRSSIGKLLSALVIVGGFLACGAEAQELARTHRLSDFYGGSANPRLEGDRASLTVSVPLAAVSEVRSATLALHGVHSIALLPDRSVLSVRFNNATIAQIPLRRDQPSFDYPVEIPAELWRSGFNSVEFSVAQHSVESCEDPGSPDLWTELDLFKSTLSVNIQRRYPEDISGLSAIFNPGIGSQESILILTPATLEATSPSFRDALPGVAQALALRRQYRPLAIRERALASRAPASAFAVDGEGIPRRSAPVDPRSVAHYLGADDDTFHVIVGARDALREALPAETIDAISGPYIALDGTPGAGTLSEDGQPDRLFPAAHRLIVSGRNDGEVVTAARSLALMLDPLQRGSEVTVRELRDTGPARDSTTIAGLRPGNEYRLASLGTRSRSFRGPGRYGTEVPLILPADFYVHESADAELFLDFGYSPELGPSSTLNVLVNGDIVGGIALNNPDGGAFYRYRLTIPARILRGGRNTLTLEVNLNAPLSEFPCARPGADHLLFNLRGTSSIALPEAGRVTRQPDLALFGRTAYPLSGQNAGQTGYIVLANRDLTGAALTLAGRLAQAAGVAINELALTMNAPTTGSEAAGIIQLASIEALTEDARDRLSLALGATQRTPYRLQNSIYNRVNSLAYGDDQAPYLTGGDLSLESSLGDLAVLHAARGEGGSTRLLITAESDEIVEARVADLIEPALWGQLEGDVFAWRSAREAELIMRVEPVHVIGSDESRWLTLRLWFTHHPWLWLGVLLVLIGLLSLLVYRLLRRRDEAISEDW